MVVRRATSVVDIVECFQSGNHVVEQGQQFGFGVVVCGDGGVVVEPLFNARSNVVGELVVRRFVRAVLQLAVDRFEFVLEGG